MHLLLKPVAVGLLMLAGIPLQGQTQQRSDANPEITTVGRGEIRVAPDRATVLIMVPIGSQFIYPTRAYISIIRAIRNNANT